MPVPGNSWLSLAMTLSLKFLTPGDRTVRQPNSWRGCSAETVAVVSGDAYEFAHTGDRHYLALHDMRLADGELNVDSHATVRAHDLRDTLTFVPQGCRISGWAKPEPRENRFTAVYFDPAVMHEELDARYEERVVKPAIYARDPSLQATVEKLQSLLMRPDSDPLLAESLCLTAALEVFAIVADPVTGRLSQRQMALVRAFVDEYIGHPISLTDLADAVGLSRFYFSRAFKATTGQSPYRFVATLRVEAAARILKASTASLDVVAASVGFSSSSQFRRTFQNRMGITPNEYRRRSQ